jgi:hypothetical protein
MSRQQIEDWVQIVGILAVVGSLIFVGLQLRQATETRAYEGAFEAQQAITEWRALLAEHSEVWPRGCAGEELTSEESFIFRMLYSAWMSRMYSLGGRGTAINSESLVNRGVYSIAINVHSFKGIRREYEADDRFYELSRFRPELMVPYLKRVDLRLAHLASVDPNPDFDVRFCGT